MTGGRARAALALGLAAVATGVGSETVVKLPPERLLGSDEAYASVLFDGLVPYDEVLATRRWNAAAWVWDCTYAIVSLAGDAPAKPPSRAADGPLGWPFSFGGAWRPTPMPSLGDTTRDARAQCADHWDDAVDRRIKAALDAPGSWYWTDGVGEQLHLYSIPQRIAARIRFGD